jgi:predicted HicB family RNase H-like nuclease
MDEENRDKKLSELVRDIQQKSEEIQALQQEKHTAITRYLEYCKTQGIVEQSILTK